MPPASARPGARADRRVKNTIISAPAGDDLHLLTLLVIRHVAVEAVIKWYKPWRRALRRLGAHRAQPFGVDVPRCGPKPTLTRHLLGPNADMQRRAVFSYGRLGSFIGSTDPASASTLLHAISSESR
jgi:hypothetical protein